MKNTVFDPFKDFASAGYLRNHQGVKDQQIIMEAEDLAFRTYLNDALNYLEECEVIDYEDFLQVHRILFESFYPWAGRDRAEVSPNVAISKGRACFCHPNDCHRAVKHGLELGSNPVTMRDKPGEVMGLFAYGHPFLDGNGRAMLVVHTELCARANFAIDWARTNKRDYLENLTREIETPGEGILDAYVGQFIVDERPRDTWQSVLCGIPGLSGDDGEDVIDGDFSEPSVAEKYREFSEQRNYRAGEA